MSRQSQIEREESRIEAAYERGELSREEYNEEMRQLQREYREAYEQDLEDAQMRVRDEWGW
jgi:hypothetical protein